MRSTPAYLSPHSGSSRKASFYRTKRRDYILPFLAILLLLLGSFRLAGYADLSVADNVSKFQISFGFMALGYVLSWYFSKRLIWLMLLVAAVARIAMLPIESGDALDRKLWDSRLLAADRNPYQLSPNAEELAAFRSEGWEELLDRESPSRYLPGLLWTYGALDAFGDPKNWMKAFLVVVDLLLCLVFALRFGARRAVLYAWNPLAIYSVGGLGVDTSLYLLPLVGGYLIWDFWVDKKGGVSVIKASGGISSALGQMVCLAAFLIGIGVSMNLIALPMLLWLVWHVLRRSGLRAGLVMLVFGGGPLVLSLMWASLSLDLQLGQVMPPEFGSGERGLSLIPGMVSFAFPAALQHGVWFLLLLVLGTVWLTHNCETFERFASHYLVWMIALSTAVYPWSILILAMVGVGSGNYVFRVASLTIFAYFGAYRAFGDTGIWQMPWSVQALVWIPFLAAAVHMTLRSRAKRGFYVHSF